MSAAAQLSLNLDAERAKIIAIDRVEAGADASWMEAASLVIRTLARVEDYFTTDLVWERLEFMGVEQPREPRAMGAVIRRAVRAGLIEATGRYEPSGRVDCHARPCMLWRSKR